MTEYPTFPRFDMLPPIVPELPFDIDAWRDGAARLRELDKVADGMPNITDQVVTLANSGLQAKLDIAALAALESGMDFVATPPRITAPDLFEPFSLFEPLEYAIESKAGPVSPGLEWPSEWIVYRLAAWQALTDAQRDEMRAKVERLIA